MRPVWESGSQCMRACAVALVLCVASSEAWAQAKSLVNVDGNGLGIHGYDPVTYFTEGKAAKGDPQYSSNYGGATYYFKSSDDKAAFDKDPAKYAPQFGGYCAMAMAMGQQEDADPNFFLVHDGKLLLQRNEKAHMMFMKDPAGNHKKADEQWKKLQGNHPG